jgi:adenine-specific DNA-methyltransferase
MNYRQKVKCIYIDPPYNAEATKILYKNEYEHSSWMSLMYDRLLLSRQLLAPDGIICVTIDDYELHRLVSLLDSIFSAARKLAVVVIRNNPSGRSTVTGFSINHEYALFYSSTDLYSIGRLPHTDGQIERYDEIDEKGRRFEWENFRKSSSGSRRADRP